MCCIATSFDASEDFGLDKAAGVGCAYLTRDCRCAIHEQLHERGFRGCAVYDCFGAGPRVTRAFARMQDCDRQRNEAFLILRVVHEQLWLLTEAAKLLHDAGEGAQPARAIDREIAAAVAREVDALDAIARKDPLALCDLDPEPYVERARVLLRRVGDAVGGRRRAARLLTVVD